MEPYSPDHVALGLAIRHFRTKLGISQEDLAEKCKLDRTFMGVIERGQRNFSFAKLLQVCDGLEISPSRLLAEYERQLKRPDP